MSNENKAPQPPQQPQQPPQQQPSPKQILFYVINQIKPDLEKTLPKHLSVDRFLQSAFTAIRNNPVLLECTPESVKLSLMEAAKLGLEIDVMGSCYLIPYNKKQYVNGRENRYKEAQLQVGYKGLLELVRRAGFIANIVANEVYEKDAFEFEYGLQERLRHVPYMGPDRGEPVAFYAYARFRDGGHSFVVMSRAEMDAIKTKNAKKNYNTGELYGTWIDHYSSMAKKTVIKQLIKYMPMSVELQETMQQEETHQQEEEPFQIPNEQ